MEYKTVRIVYGLRWVVKKTASSNGERVPEPAPALSPGGLDGSLLSLPASSSIILGPYFMYTMSWCV